MGATRNSPLQQTKTYAFFIGKLNELQNAVHLNMEQMRLARLKKSLYIFNAGTRKQLTEEGNRLYADKVNGKGRYYPIMLTLTYDIKKHPAYAQYEYWKQQCVDLGIEEPNAPSRHDIWKPYHISRLIDAYRKYWMQTLKLPRKHFRYVWVAELQQDGVLHYHVVLYSPRGRSIPKPDHYWAYGRTRTEAVRGGVNGYLMKYLSKGSIKADAQAGTSARYFPKGARIFGYGGLSSAERDDMRYAKLPKYVRDIFDKGSGEITRCPHGWRQGKVELMSCWTYHNNDRISISGHKELFKNLKAENIQTDITGKKENDFTFGLLEYNQVVWLLKDANSYRKQYQDEKREQQRVYDEAYRDALTIPCRWNDLSPTVKRYCKMTEYEYNLMRLEKLIQVMRHTTDWRKE